jgi:hypothetical protein
MDLTGGGKYIGEKNGRYTWFRNEPFIVVKGGQIIGEVGTYSGKKFLFSAGIRENGDFSEENGTGKVSPGNDNAGNLYYYVQPARMTE